MNRRFVLVVVLVLVIDWLASSRTSTSRFMVPMRDSGIVEAFHEPTHARPLSPDR